MSYISSQLSFITTDDHKWSWQRILVEHGDAVSSEDVEPWDDPAQILDVDIFSPGYAEVDMVRKLWDGGEQKFYYAVEPHLDEDYAIVSISSKPFDGKARGDILDRARVELDKFMVVASYKDDGLDKSCGWRLYVTKPGTQYANLTIQSTYYPRNA